MEWELKDFTTAKHMWVIIRKIDQTDKENTIGRMEITTKVIFRMAWDMARGTSGKEKLEYNIEDNTKTIRSAAMARLTTKMG